MNTYKNNVYNFVYESLTYNFNSISIKNFNLSVGNKNLFQNSNLILSYGNCYGLIGKNGYGKTSLLKQFNNIIEEDKLRILYVEQELSLDDRTPVQFILDSNIKLKYYEDCVKKINNEIDLLEEDYNEELFNRLQEAEENLNSYNPDKEEALIKKILFGLGFNKEMLEKESKYFSGGWQMRISLARSLYLEPDLLLLDEPTNHLDLEAVIWLIDYLLSWKKIVIVVSHNIGFLDGICDYILNIENNKIESYKGNYNKFKRALENKINEMKKAYTFYENKLKEFKKKGFSKSKIEEFIKKNAVVRPEKEYNINIQFSEITYLRSNIVSFEDVTFGYNDYNILDNINFGISMDTKVTLVGLNGCGKSTLLKLITGELKPKSGNIIINHNANIGYYNQHFDQQLPFDKTPIEFLTDEFEYDYEMIRTNLGKIKLDSTAHNKKISELSGGQKARVALIKLIFESPHLLLLDEPTNHLDIETVEALIDCLEEYTGGIILITHEAEIINRLNTKIWLLKDTKINYHIESYDKYCEIVSSNLNNLST
jgi:ATP-binding cassette subfamily F protein 1